MLRGLKKIDWIKNGHEWHKPYKRTTKNYLEAQNQFVFIGGENVHVAGQFIHP